MDVANLAAFIAVAELGGFSAAAEQLHLTQPAVSKRVAQLEAQLQVRLFDRIGRQVLPTEAGDTLLPRARRILAELDDTRRLIDTLGSGVTGTLRLATSHHVGLHRLPPLLRAFIRQHPGVGLDIRFLDSEQAWQEVLHGRVDLAVTTLGPASAPLQATTVWDDPLQFVVAPDHPLAARRQVTLADIAAHPAVLPDANTFTHRIVAGQFQQRGLALQLRMTSNTMETLKMLVSVGLAWSALPQALIDAQTVVLPVRGATLVRPLGYVVHGGRTRSNAARAFLALLDDERARVADKPACARPRTATRRR